MKRRSPFSLFNPKKGTMDSTRDNASEGTSQVNAESPSHSTLNQRTHNTPPNILPSSHATGVRSQNKGSATTKRSSLGLVLVCLVAGFFGGWVGSERNISNRNISMSDLSDRQQIVLTESQVITDIAKSVGESVVSITSTTQVQRNSFFFGPTTQEAEGAGTGIIINEDGLILTNKHVVPEGTSSVTVTLSDGTELDDVEVIGRGRQSEDIAFLKIKDKKDKTLKAAKIGISSDMKVGDKVIAIGNAKGRFQNTVTEGIVSGTGRSIEAGDQSGASEELYNLIQTDAAINPGNSGGPLVNINGEIIGINTAIDGDAQGIGFAIPIDDVKSLITSVSEKGKLIRPYLGVHYVNITDDYAYQFNLSVKRGAYLAPSARTSNGGTGQNPVIKDSPAEKAGLKEKDIITKVNDITIDENHILSSVLGTFNAGDKIKLTIVRDGSEQTIEVTLGEAPQS